jgi:hypothetical protein
MEFSIDIHNSL